MLNSEDAKGIAKNHIDFLEPPCDGYFYVLDLESIRRVETGWFFGYRIRCELDIPEADRQNYADAVGFVVDEKSGSVTPISHHQWVDLGLAFCDHPYGGTDL